MKRKILTLIIVGIMSMSLVACGEKKEGTTSSNNNNNNNKTVTSNGNKNDDKEEDNAHKITEDEMKKISNNNIERLKAFYEKHGLPAYTDNLYNNSVDEARIYLSTADLYADKIDSKGMSQGEYQYVNSNFTIQASITIAVAEGEEIDINNSLAKEYAEAIVNGEVDFSDAQKKLQEYYNNFTSTSKKFEEVIENEEYRIRVLAVGTDRYVVDFYSKYEVK